MSKTQTFPGLHTGVVDNWGTHGYGFIRPDEEGPMLFVHRREVWNKEEPKVGDRVRFKVRLDKGKLQACRVTILK